MVLAVVFSIKGGFSSVSTAVKASQPTAVALGSFLALLNLGARGLRVSLLKQLKLNVCKAQNQKSRKIGDIS